MKNVIVILLTSTLLVAWDAPTMPKGEVGRMVKLGQAIAMDTANHPLTKEIVGNTLACKSCHLQNNSNGFAGTGKGLATFVGTATVFPAYSAREQKLQTLEDRSNNCFMRSLSGKRLENGSEASLALSTYITWLSTGMPMKMEEKRPVTPLKSEFYASGQKKFAKLIKNSSHENYLNGQKLFDAKCASCHQKNGSGMSSTFPALWGYDKHGKELAFNAGAGMADPKKSAVWIQDNMPQYQENTLSDQEASDIALYVDAQPRGSFDVTKGVEDLKHYNSKVKQEIDTVRSRFKSYDLNIDKIRGDKIIP